MTDTLKRVQWGGETRNGRRGHVTLIIIVVRKPDTSHLLYSFDGSDHGPSLNWHYEPRSESPQIHLRPSTEFLCDVPVRATGRVGVVTEGGGYVDSVRPERYSKNTCNSSE